MKGGKGGTPAAAVAQWTELWWWCSGRTSNDDGGREDLGCSWLGRCE
ncbi:hypothetical protein TIFTF001_012366 [Ficus carica]|uniref:Uncharacterized protein n=1 Tax=Ficus carica TaxID=3494 RepID=A0AA88D3M1_FICCA|nr:hypothetical protein TIFTF001_012366 [Ficus carica]